MELEDLEVYNLSNDLGNKIWEIVLKWDWFEKKGIGQQLTDAADSIGANISEGFGRLSPQDNRRFCFFARGSLYEVSTWLYKAHCRGLIEVEAYAILEQECNNLQVKLWNDIKTLEKNIQ